MTKVHVLELNVSQYFTLMKKVVLNVYSTQSTMCYCVRNINKSFRIANLFTWLAKHLIDLCTVSFPRNFKIKVHTLNKLEFLNFSLHDIVKWLGLLRKMAIFIRFPLKASIFKIFVNKSRFPVSDRPTNDKEQRFSALKSTCSQSWWEWVVFCCTTQTSHPNSWLVTNFWKMNSPKSTKGNQQNDQNFGEEKLEMQNRFILNRTPILSLQYGSRRQFW